MNDFITSDYCPECDGCGYVTYTTPLFDDVQIEKEQCAECEYLHKQEIKADRLYDEMKGN